MSSPEDCRWGYISPRRDVPVTANSGKVLVAEVLEYLSSNFQSLVKHGVVRVNVTKEEEKETGAIYRRIQPRYDSHDTTLNNEIRRASHVSRISAW